MLVSPHTYRRLMQRSHTTHRGKHAQKHTYMLLKTRKTMQCNIQECTLNHSLTDVHKLHHITQGLTQKCSRAHRDTNIHCIQHTQVPTLKHIHTQRDRTTRTTLHTGTPRRYGCSQRHTQSLYCNTHSKYVSTHRSTHVCTDTTESKR